MIQLFMVASAHAAADSESATVPRGTALIGLALSKKLEQYIPEAFDVRTAAQRVDAILNLLHFPEVKRESLTWKYFIHNAADSPIYATEGMQTTTEEYLGMMMSLSVMAISNPEEPENSSSSITVFVKRAWTEGDNFRSMKVRETYDALGNLSSRLVEIRDEGYGTVTCLFKEEATLVFVRKSAQLRPEEQYTDLKSIESELIRSLFGLIIEGIHPLELLYGKYVTSTEKEITAQLK